MEWFGGGWNWYIRCELKMIKEVMKLVKCDIKRVKSGTRIVWMMYI